MESMEICRTKWVLTSNYAGFPVNVPFSPSTNSWQGHVTSMLHHSSAPWWIFLGLCYPVYSSRMFQTSSINLHKVWWLEWKQQKLSIPNWDIYHLVFCCSNDQTRATRACAHFMGTYSTWTARLWIGILSPKNFTMLSNDIGQKCVVYI
jgi:hypothetical protein